MRILNVLVQRTKMIGGGLSYRLYVPLEELSETFKKHCHHFIACESSLTDKYFVTLEQALLPDFHMAMEPGIERWEAFKQHEKEVAGIAFKVASFAFPELAKCGKMPTLWVNGLMEEETSAEAWVPYAKDDNEYPKNNV